MRGAVGVAAGVSALTVAGSASAHSAERGNRLIPKPKDLKKEPFKRMVVLGESTVAGGEWVPSKSERFADVLARLINECQEKPVEYYNKGIGGNAISPRSPGYKYPASAKPSAMERYKRDVIELNPDLFILCYGLNDMRVAMPIRDFREDMATTIRDIQKAWSPLTVLTTVYHMTGWERYAPFDKGSVELTLRYNDCIRGLVLLCYKSNTPQRGQKGSWEDKRRAILMRKVAIEFGLCRSARTRPAGPEVGRKCGRA